MAEAAANSKQIDESLDVGAQNIATAYAKALFRAAEGAQALDAVVADLNALLDELLAKHPKIAEVLASAIFEPEQKEQMIDRALKQHVHPLLTNFLKVLARHSRSHLLGSIRDALRKMHDQARGRFPVRITTAATMTESQKTAVLGRMKAVLGGEPILQTEVDPSLIGGLVAQVGDVVFDGSLAANLARLREQLINRSVHEIQRRRDRVRPTS